MKRAYLILPILILLSIVSGTARPALAHPPAGIDMNWVATKGVLEVTVRHPVRTPRKHYIDLIVIKVNGGAVVEKPYTMQTNPSSEIDVFPLGTLAAGTKVTVIARCNVNGVLERSIHIP